MTKRVRILAVALYAAFVAAASGQTVIDGSFPVDLATTIEDVHQAVSGEFLDPRSAQYKSLVVRDRLVDDLVICGWVNAKNSLGGYTPFYPFAYRLKDQKAYLGEGYDDEILGKLTMVALSSSGCPASALGL